ncbi:MAG: META domain-containing protein [Ferruginibacter sp.]
MNIKLNNIVFYFITVLLISSCTNTRKSSNDISFLFSNSEADVAQHKLILNSGDWRLTEVNGQPVDSVNGEIPFIHLDDSGNISGTAGCNKFRSTFVLEKGNRIKFSSILSTKMACADMSVEDRLFPILDVADNYNLNEYELILNKAKMAPLAKFARMGNK